MSQKHIDKCAAKYPKDRLGKSYVICAICWYHGKSLGKHVSDIHGVSSIDYQKLYGSIKCEESFQSYSNQNKSNGDWISRANDAGEDLTEYKLKMASAVSNAIIASPEERKRRAKLLGDLNKTQEFRQKSSKTAIKTSARPEILKKRSEQLKKWRDSNFEEFYEKCVRAMLNCWHSKPQLALFELAKMIDGYSFKSNQFVKSETFTKKSKRKQIDIADSKMRVYIEFDGPYHFKNINGTLEEIQSSDKLLDEHITRHGWTLIRVSYDQWNGKKFDDACLKQFFEVLKNPKPGVVKIGKAYEAEL